MKRLSLIVTLVGLIGFTAFAQQPINHPRNAPTFQHANIEKMKLKLNETRNQIDTFINFFPLPCDSFIWTPTVSFSGKADSGFLCGNNTFLDSSKAEQYTGIPGNQINGLWMWFGYAKSTSSTQVIHVRVWDATGANGSPGNVIGTKDVTIQSIVPDVNNFDLTTVNFTTPIPMPAGGNFYAGFTMDYKKKQNVMVYDSTRAVAIFSTYPANSHTGVINSCSDDSTENTAWEQWTSAFGSGGGWHSFWDAYGGAWAERNAIFPIVETTSTCTVTITPSAPAVCKKKAVSLTASVSGGGGTWTWAPATGLNVTTGATVSAKPNSSTTYTATNSGGCTGTVHVTVNPTPTGTISQGACSASHILLSANANPNVGVKYKWYFNNAAIAGATNSTYSAGATGSYKVKVTITATNCVKTEKAVTVTITCKSSDINSSVVFDASAYPNPFTKSVSVNIATGSTEAATISVLDFSGRTLRMYSDVDASVPFEINENLTPGVYFVKVAQGGNEKVIKVVKSE